MGAVIIPKNQRIPRLDSLLPEVPGQTETAPAQRLHMPVPADVRCIGDNMSRPFLKGHAASHSFFPAFPLENEPVVPDFVRVGLFVYFHFREPVIRLHDARLRTPGPFVIHG